MGHGSVKTLHILNGDATLDIFRKSGLEGETMVWREVLVEGPVREDIRDPLFQEMRKGWFEVNYDLGPSEFDEKIGNVITVLMDLSTYDEVVLWFEFDLFCQVNLIGCLSLIHHDRISLVCVGEENGILKGLGERDPDTYPDLFRKRIRLGKWEIDFAQMLWKAYQLADMDRINRLSRFPPHTFRYIRPAFQAFFDMQPDKDGIGAIEKEMLLAIRNGIPDERSLIGHMLKWQKWYGFGDLQYIRILKKRSDLFLRDPLRLSSAGFQAISRDD